MTRRRHSRPRQAQQKSSRTFTKRFALACVLMTFIVTMTGLIAQHADLSNIVLSFGGILLGFMYVYADVGHRDLRVMKGLPTLFEAVAAMRTRKREPDA